MTELQQKQLVFLDDTVAHYNSNNRCANDQVRCGMGCKYSPETLHLEGKSEGCAIGRHLTPELAKELDNGTGNKGVKAVFNKLPDNLKELDASFLTLIQLLHDNPNYWDENGLSEEGRESYSTIKRVYDLN
jgi:hypothetical protein